MNPIKVLHLIPTVEDGKGLGGAEKLLLFMLEKIDKKKFEFIVAYHLPARLKEEDRTKVEEEFEKRGAKVELFKTSGKFDLTAVKKLSHMIKEENVDIVHSHQPRVDFLGAIASKITKTPMVITRHLPISDSYIGQGKIKIYQFVDSLMTMRLADKICAVSKEIAVDLIDKEDVPKDKIVVVYNGIDCDKFREKLLEGVIRKEFNLNREIPLVGIIARLNRQKSHQYFLEAAFEVLKKIPETKFLIVGDGPLRKDHEKLAIKLGIESKVIFTGYRTDIAQIISELDIVVLSSLAEGLPVVILEAMAMGKPVVSFKVGGVSEVIEDGNTGILAEPKDTMALAKGIVMILKDKEKADKMGRLGEETIKKTFSLETMIKKYEEIYYSLYKGQTNQ